MKQALRILIDIFQPDGIDWMNFTLSKNNPYTFHHIVEKSKGGEKKVDNGAILTKNAHIFLNKLQKVCPDAYNDLQVVFAKINASKQPVTEEIVAEIDEILKKVLITHEYEFTEDTDLTSYCDYYYMGKRKAKKCLK